MGKKEDRTGFYRRGKGRIWYTVDPVTGNDTSTRCADLGAAKLWRTARERLAADPNHAAAQVATLGDECRLMLNALATLKKPTDYYERKLGHWVRVLGNDRPLAEAGSPAGFDRFVEQRRSEGVTDHTISKEIKCMITTLKNAERSGRWSGNTAVLRPFGFTAGYVPRTRALTVAELGALLATLEPEAQAFVIFVTAFGLRRGEAMAIRPGDLDLANWTLHVRGTKTEGSLRDLPVLAPFRPLVVAAARHLPLEWAKTSNYVKALEWACKRAGIAKTTGNDLRRTHATLLRTAGVTADVARALLGHTKGSQLLELVYDKPKPHELASRAGDLAGLSEQVSALSNSIGHLLHPIEKHGTNIGQKPDNQRPWGPFLTQPGRDDNLIPGTSETVAGPEGPRRDEDALHRPSVLIPAREALALAAYSAFAGHALRRCGAVATSEPARKSSGARG